MLQKKPEEEENGGARHLPAWETEERNSTQHNKSLRCKENEDLDFRAPAYLGVQRNTVMRFLFLLSNHNIF